MPDRDITALLGRVRDGDRGAVDRVVELVYAELEVMAGRLVASGTSIEPSGLVHELYLRLVRGGLDARDRGHLLSIAALAMRQILADRSRRRRAAKRGGDAARVTLSGLADEPVVCDAVAVDAALDRLRDLDARHASVVELRCLAGLTVAEIAVMLGVSERTIHSDWRMARAWLRRELSGTTR